MANLNPESPVPDMGYRLKNIIKNNWRGILGFLLGLISLKFITLKPGDEPNACLGIWILMIIFYIFQPVTVPVTSFIPIFLFPLTNALPSIYAASLYFSENIMLLIMTNMLMVLWNCSGLDRRVIYHFMCSGDSCQFSGKRLVFKASLAAFFCGMFCNKLIASSKIMTLTAPVLTNLHKIRYKKLEPNYKSMNDVINNAVQTSSVIGGLLFVHTTFTVMNFRNMYTIQSGPGMEYEDSFNYFNYFCFIAPWVILMFFVNCGYNMLLINWLGVRSMPAAKMTFIRESFLKEKSKIPKKITAHELLCLFFSLFATIMFVFRWSPWIKNGWSVFRPEAAAPKIPKIRDSTVASFFVILLSMLPKDVYFYKYLFAKHKADLPPAKPTSAILFWKYADMNTYYCYFIVMGAGAALCSAFHLTGYDKKFMDGPGILLCAPWLKVIAVIIIIAGVTANLMPGMAACNVLVPPILGVINRECVGLCANWNRKKHQAGLAIAIATSFGFIMPHQYTPAYFVKSVGKTKPGSMGCIGFGSFAICLLITWVAFVGFANLTFPAVCHIPVSVATEAGAAATTAAPEGGGGGGGGEPAPPGDRRFAMTLPYDDYD